ncbi:MAG: ATP-binding cassette domain-containing protein [Spirochaetes bacterium]|nr:ATP-binding cassette domain-containing protein [Spirochaetota bacterium]MBN2769783.1 ATP-binding cassette domain-containing protein [Spirochaetota bacterium]
MLTVDCIKKNFCDNKVLQSVSFHIPQGQVVGLLGENGAGKTTLFRIICSLISADEGNVFINGQALDEDRNCYPSVFFGGSSGLYSRLSARENITYFANLNGVSGDVLNDKIDYFSNLLDMNDYIDRKTLQFSHGMKQKTALVRMAVINSPLMLLDEPTTGMDFPSIVSVADFIQHQKNESKTILYSSHNISELSSICQRVIILHKGIIKADIDLIKYNDNKDNIVKKAYLRILEK